MHCVYAQARFSLADVCVQVLPRKQRMDILKLERKAISEVLLANVVMPF